MGTAGILGSFENVGEGNATSGGAVGNVASLELAGQIVGAGTKVGDGLPSKSAVI